MRILNAVLMLLLLALQGQLWLGEGGMQTWMHQRDQLQAMQADLELRRSRNAALQAEIDDLTHGSLTVEEIARENLGYIRPGEQFIRVVDASELVR